jgi:serine/threonine-protein kinase
MLEGGTIGPYRIVRKLGQGGMGTVYLGEHTLLGRQAAIKVLLPGMSAQEEAVQRFFNEARAVTRIADPGIVQVFDFGFHPDGNAFIIMELLEGEAMDHRLARVGRFGVNECVRVMRQICASLAAAHAKGVIHRDLKPENIILVSDGAVAGGERAKILDFGIAKLIEPDPNTEPALRTQTGTMIGTPVYMSPEQCRGDGEVDHRTDVYAIGCVMCTMLTGKPPFDLRAPGELVVAHLLDTPPRVSSRVAELPEIIDRIVDRCLQKEPAVRFQTMIELGHALEAAERTVSPSTAAPTIDAETRFVASGPTTMTRATGQATVRERPAKAAPARRWLAAAVVGAAIAAGVVGVAMLRGGGDGEPVVVPAKVVAPVVEPKVAPVEPVIVSVDAGVDEPAAVVVEPAKPVAPVRGKHVRGGTRGSAEPAFDRSD